MMAESARGYLKSSPQEDNLILEAINLYRRGDYFSILQYMSTRIHVLSPSVQNFYMTSSFEQKKTRIYKRQKSLLEKQVRAALAVSSFILSLL